MLPPGAKAAVLRAEAMLQMRARVHESSMQVSANPCADWCATPGTGQINVLRNTRRGQWRFACLHYAACKHSQHCWTAFTLLWCFLPRLRV